MHSPESPDAVRVTHRSDAPAERPNHIVFTFAVPKYAPDRTRVSIDIVPLGTQCDLTLSHDPVPAEYRELATQGWKNILNGLALIVA